MGVPPCPSHSHIRKELAVEQAKQNKPVYPDMKLYEEILLLDGYFKGKWVVENVVSWYKPLIRPFEVASHYYWANFPIVYSKDKCRNHMGNIDTLSERKGFDLKDVKGVDKRKVLRNCVELEMGLFVFKSAFKDKQHTLNLQ